MTCLFKFGIINAFKIIKTLKNVVRIFAVEVDFVCFFIYLFK